MEVRNAHPYFMYDDILKQPEYIEKTLSKYKETSFITKIAHQIYKSKRLILIGCGTSFNVALSVKDVSSHIFGKTNLVEAVPSFELVHSQFSLSNEDCIISFSHSGETHMTNKALKLARENGCKTVSVTAFPSSTSGQTADYVLPTLYQDERSLAHTISYSLSFVSALLLLGALAEIQGFVGIDTFVQEEVDKLSQLIKSILEDEEQFKNIALNMAEKDLLVFVGTGTSLGVASEIALKSIETHYTPSFNYDLEHTLHGPLPMCNEKTQFVLILPNNQVNERTNELLMALKHIKSDSFILSPSQPFNEATNHYKLPPFNEIISPIISVVPLQLLTYFTATNKKLNPDLIRRDNSKYHLARGAYV
ncbi:SIS domain-containing protein [Halobacillus sp. B23F22_1]|uniref:SIS domain-containing protein n=1 Tax=Halobacillus sp. B23F22_1 TaxID=3459514 RepID=UPI00373EA342